MRQTNASRSLTPTRADLLVSPSALLSTSFQMEYLPSGATCRGTVTRIHADGFGFDSRCSMPNGAGRAVTAHWQPGQGTTLQGGVLTAQPV